MAAAAHPLAGVQAFLFDVFGTVVDWRTGVVEELQARLVAVAPHEGASRLRPPAHLSVPLSLESAR